MGCGKSSIGRIIAGRTDWLFIDLDSRIESSEKKSINEIFAEGGNGTKRTLRRRNRCDELAVTESKKFKG